MIRSTPYNLAKIFEQGRNDALHGKFYEDRRWTWKQHAEYLDGYYSVKAPNGTLRNHADHSNLDLY